MKAMTVGELKAQFSQALDDVQNGEDIQVLFGRVKKSVAVITSVEKFAKQDTQKNPQKRSIGLYENKASFSEIGDGKITHEELLGF